MSLFVGALLALLLCALAFGLRVMFGAAPLKPGCGLSRDGAECDGCPGRSVHGVCRRAMNDGEEIA